MCAVHWVTSVKRFNFASCGDSAGCNMRMAPYGRVVLLALCLTWTGAIRAFAQGPNPPSSPIGPEPGHDFTVSETQPAAAAGDKATDGEAGASSTSTASPPAPFGGPWNSRP